MKDPVDKRGFSIIELILVILVIILAYVLYTNVGGIAQLGNSTGSPGPFSQIGESLGAFGQGLKNMLGNIAP